MIFVLFTIFPLLVYYLRTRQNNRRVILEKPLHSYTTYLPGLRCVDNSDGLLHRKLTTKEIIMSVDVEMTILDIVCIL